MQGGSQWLSCAIVKHDINNALVMYDLATLYLNPPCLRKNSQLLRKTAQYLEDIQPVLQQECWGSGP